MNGFTKSFDDLVRRGEEAPTEIFAEAAEAFHWDRKWDQVMDDSESPFTKWFVGGWLNMCYNCLDRQVERGLGNEVTLVYDSPVTNTIRNYTYIDILQNVEKLAGLLASYGVKKGDIVAVYMPTIPEGVFAFLACCRIGAIHNAIPGGLPAEDMALRIEHSEPKVLLTASHGYHSSGWISYQNEVEKCLQICKHKLTKCIWYQRIGMDPVKVVPGFDIIWQDALRTATPHPCVSVEATSPLFVLYTSGSTGTPKAVVHAVGSYAVATSFQMCYIWDVELMKTVFGTTSLGWIAGHSILVYGPLLSTTAKTILYEGDPLLMSDSRETYRVLSEHKVSMAMIRPGVIKSMKGMDPDAKIAKEYDFSNLKLIIAAGEHIDSVVMDFVYKSLGAPITNGYGQSELAGAILGQCDTSVFNETFRYSMTGKIWPGWRLKCLREDMTPTNPGEIGRFLVQLPMPPGTLSTLYKNDKLCKATYYDPYPGYFDTKDEGYITENGEAKMERRADDMIKAGPIYVSSIEIEDVINKHPSVGEVAVAAQPHNAHREIPIAFVVLSSANKLPHSDVCSEIVTMVHSHFGRSMPFESVVIIEDFPRTMTGKTSKKCLTSILKKVSQGSKGIENPESLSAVIRALEEANVI